MPRKSKPPRLWLRNDRFSNDGKIQEKAVWLILDGGMQRSTGCGTEDYEGAEIALAEYIIEKHDPKRSYEKIEDILIADALNLYLLDVVPNLATKRKAIGRISRLLDFWGEMRIVDLTKSNCLRFTASRSKGAARRELQDLQAAINHRIDNPLNKQFVKLHIPRAGGARKRWLTRSEVAHLIRICLHYPELQNGVPTKKRPLRHLARFILIGLYTGSRPGDCLTASFDDEPGRSWANLEEAIFYRQPLGKDPTANKLQNPIPIPKRLEAHFRRWRRLGAKNVVEFEGKPISSIKTAFGRLVKIADVPPGLMPYTLRHTCATWKVMAGVPFWDVAGLLSTSPEMIRRHYGHHCPTHLRAATNAGTQSRPNKTL